MKQLDVQIMGQSYLLACPEGGDVRLLDAVQQVDSAMCKIRDSGKVRARDRIAVLAALNLAFDLADRGAAPPPAPAAVMAKSLASEPAPVVSAVCSDLLLSSLLERLDHALGEDGRLL